MSDDLRGKIARAIRENRTVKFTASDGYPSVGFATDEELADAVLAALPREYAIARPASMPDMSGKPTYTLIVGSTFPTREQAENARRRVPSLRDAPTLIVSRIAPLSVWEEATDA